MTPAPTWSRLPWRSLVGAVVLVAVVRQTGSGPFVAGGPARSTRTTLAWGAVLAARHHRRLRLAVAPRRAGAGRRDRGARGGRVLLPRPVPQHGPARRDPRRRAPRASCTAGPSARPGSRCVPSPGSAAAGQVVHLVLAVVVLLVLPSPLRGRGPAGRPDRRRVLLLAVALVARRPRGPASVAGPVGCWPPCTTTSGAASSCAGPGPGVVVASCVATAGHVATFVVAARAVGVDPAPGGAAAARRPRPGRRRAAAQPRRLGAPRGHGRLVLRGRRGSARRRAWRRPSRTARWCWWPTCRDWSCCWPPRQRAGRRRATCRSPVAAGGAGVPRG